MLWKDSKDNQAKDEGTEEARTNEKTEINHSPGNITTVAIYWNNRSPFHLCGILYIIYRVQFTYGNNINAKKKSRKITTM